MSSGLFKVARALYSPMHYPGDYGFIPGTIAEDGEPLDVLSLVSVPSFTGCLCYVRPIAVLDMYEGQRLPITKLSLCRITTQGTKV